MNIIYLFIYGMNVICKNSIHSTAQTDVTFLLDVSWSALSSYIFFLGFIRLANVFQYQPHTSSY